MSAWLWLALAAALGLASALLCMLAISAGTAYGTEYHTLSARQRAMARLLYLGALAAATIAGLAGIGAAAWALRLLIGR